MLGRDRSRGQVLEPCCGLWPLRRRWGRLSLRFQLGSELEGFAGRWKEPACSPVRWLEELAWQGDLPGEASLVTGQEGVRRQLRK